MTIKSTHRALANLDVLAQIIDCFEFVYFHGVDPAYAQYWLLASAIDEEEGERVAVELARTRTLAQLARVCKAFCGPALSMLWCQLHSLLPVLRLLPSLTMVAAQVKMERRYGAIPRDIYHLPKEMALDEWDRLTGYAAYVRKLYVVQSPHLRPRDITAESWTLIVQAFGNRPLLPNLRALEWNTDQPDTEFAGLTAFLAPTLENLTVFCDAHSPWESTLLEPAWRSRVDQFIREIPRRVPRLVNFFFHCGALHPDCVVGPLSLNHPHSLRALTLAADYNAGPLSHFSITAMARLTTVEYLNFRLAVADIPLADLPPKLELDKLEHLFLSPTGAPGANLAYGLFASVNLRILDLQNVQYTGAAALRRMVTAHARSFPRLEVYHCWLSYQHVQSLPEPHASLSELFRPLLGLRRLRDFIVTINWIPIEVNDYDLTSFAQAWPSLERLHIVLAVHEPAPCTTGLAGLSALAPYCPRLSSLNLTCLVVRPDDIARLPLEAPSPPHRLRTLKVNYGMLPETYHLVRDRIFPDLNATLKDGVYSS